MYSVVLMMALTTGADLPAHHRGGCWGGGCTGYAAACCGESYGGCWGGRARHHRRGHRRGGCWGGSGWGCTGGYASCGCCGGSAGYVGGCWGGCTGYIGGCTGYVGGCMGSMGGCWGGSMAAPMIGAPTGPSTPPPPPPPPPGKRPERVAPPKGTMAAAPAVIIVSLPAEATLRVDGHLTRSSSDVRTFASPALEPGKDYVYTLKAEYVRQGKPLEQTQRVSVRAGQQTRVEFTFGATRVAQK